MLKKLFKYKFLYVYVLTILCSSSALATSLEEAFVSSYETNPQIKAAIASLQSVDESMPLAISGALPSASASGQRGKKSTSTGTIDASGITDTKSIEVTQPLFKGGRTYSEIKKAKNEIMSAREQLRNTEQQVLLSAATAYMDVVSNQEVYELAKNNKAVLQKHLEATQARFDLGEVTRTDVAESNASLAKAESDLISAERVLESSKATYEKTIGQPSTGVSMPKAPIEIKGNIDELVAVAMENNPSIKIASYNLDASKNDVNIQKSVLLPQVNAFANKQRQYDILTGATEPSTIYSTTVGVNLSIPIYQAGAEYARIRQAKHIAGRNSFNLSVTRDEIREAVIKAFQDFRVAQSLIKSNESSVTASTVALEGETQEALAGLRTTIEVLDAQQALFDAKANLIKSRRDEIVSSYTLLAQLGKLTVKELGLKLDTYNPEKNYQKVKHQIIGF